MLSLGKSPREENWGGDQTSVFWTMLGNHDTVSPVAPCPYHVISLTRVFSPPKYWWAVPSEMLQFWKIGLVTKFEWTGMCQDSHVQQMSPFSHKFLGPHVQGGCQQIQMVTTPHLSVQAECGTQVLEANRKGICTTSCLQSRGLPPGCG